MQSCIGLKDLKYLQPNSNLKLNEHGLVSKNIEKYRLQIDDIVSVNIRSLDPEAAKFLLGQNIGEVQNQQQGGGQGGNRLYFNGYKINSDGKITILGLGEFLVLGKTVEEVEDDIRNKLNSTIYKDDITDVKVRMEGVNFTILGEVGSSGQKTIARVNVNLLDAIAASGDLNKLADRQNIIIIRQYPEGSKQVNVDITREDIQNSPYYWVQPNDFIIVNPRKEKITGLGGNSYVSDVTQVLTLAISAITMYLFFTNLN